MNGNKVTFQSRMEALLEGVQKHLPSDVRMVFNGRSLDGITAAQELKGHVESYDRVEQAAIQYAKAVTSRRVIEPNAKELVKGVVSALMAIHGNDPEKLALFGLTVPKAKKQRTTEEKAASAAKAKKTREDKKKKAAGT